MWSKFCPDLDCARRLVVDDGDAPGGALVLAHGGGDGAGAAGAKKESCFLEQVCSDNQAITS